MFKHYTVKPITILEHQILSPKMWTISCDLHMTSAPDAGVYISNLNWYIFGLRQKWPHFQNQL